MDYHPIQGGVAILRDKFRLYGLGHRLYLYLREEATTALAGFHAGPLSRLKWNLEMLVFVEGGKLVRRTWRKTLRARTRTNNKLKPRMAPGQNQTRARRVLSPLLYPCLPLHHRDPYSGFTLVLNCIQSALALCCDILGAF